MNAYIVIGVIVALLIVGYLVIIREAITVDRAKASAALTAFLARFKRKP